MEKLESLHGSHAQEVEDDMQTETIETNYCIKGYDYMAA